MFIMFNYVTYYLVSDGLLH